MARVTIATIQRLYSMLRGDAELAEDLDELSAFEVEPERPSRSTTTPPIPIDTFDVIIVDECHRSIYGVWRQVLEYFDAFLIGLTATPGKQTFGFFNKNLVMEYGFPQAVADGVNVDFDVFRLSHRDHRGRLDDRGRPRHEFRDRETRAERWRSSTRTSPTTRRRSTAVVAKDQIRTVVRDLP